MCRLVRCTVKRATRCRPMRVRVCLERRTRWSFLVSISVPLLLLRFLDRHLLVGVADALALVGLGRAQRADFGSDLADRLPVEALDDDLGLRRALDLDAGWHLLRDRMRVADLQVELRALRGGTVADADQRQTLLEPLGDAADHAGDE